MRRLHLVFAIVAMLSPALALGQRVYTWTDGRGVVHFSDQRPADAPNVQERSVGPVAPIVAGQGTTDEDTLAAPTPGAQPSPSVPAVTGPARVILLGDKAELVSAQTRHVSGKVKNVGGETARRVSVEVNVTDADQGSPCLTRDVNVSPDDLEPGDTGTFDEDVDTPCFLGNAGLTVSPAWD